MTSWKPINQVIGSAKNQTVSINQLRPKNVSDSVKPTQSRTYGSGQVDRNRVDHHFDSHELKRERLRQATLARFNSKKGKR